MPTKRDGHFDSHEILFRHGDPLARWSCPRFSPSQGYRKRQLPACKRPSWEGAGRSWATIGGSRLWYVTSIKLDVDVYFILVPWFAPCFNMGACSELQISPSRHGQRTARTAVWMTQNGFCRKIGNWDLPVEDKRSQPVQSVLLGFALNWHLFQGNYSKQVHKL